MDSLPIENESSDDWTLQDTPMDISSSEDSGLEDTPMDIPPSENSELEDTPMDISSSESSNSKTSSNTSASVAVNLPVPNSSLSHGDLNMFMLGGILRARKNGLEVKHRPSSTGGATSAKMALLRNRRVTMAVDGLSGCTGLGVVSRKAVWLAHLWEAPSFQSREHFTRDILDVICVGDPTIDYEGTPWVPGLDQLSAEFTVAHKVVAIIMTPVPQNVIAVEFSTANVRYKGMVELLMDKLHQFLPGAPILVFDYKPCRRLENLLSARGKFLIQYNPNELQAGDNTEQKALLRVYTDQLDTAFYADTWTVDDENQKV